MSGGSKGYLLKKELLKRRWPTNKRPCVAFNIGDYDHLAEDMHLNEWWFRVGVTEIYRGPYPNRLAAHKAWKLVTEHVR